MFIARDLKKQLLQHAALFPVVAVVGPRQAGKTTLVQQAFPHHAYVSLENPDTLDLVRADPRGFLEKAYDAGIIIDEFQREPVLLSYMQGIVDANRRPGYFILTGSHNFLMNQAISQSLAGRVAVLTLLPLSYQELLTTPFLGDGLEAVAFKGGYPDVFVRSVPPAMFYQQYVKTYVERDVRQLVNVVDLSDFQRFMRLCAGRIGQILNITSLADDCGISVPTVKAWLSVLQASYILFLVQPHFNNFSKRLIKAPKLYFYDTGLASWLLKITSPQQLQEHYLRGGLVESAILAELQKSFYHQGQEPSMYFWRDSHGHEVDCLLDFGTKVVPVEIKASATLQQRHFEGLAYWCALAGVSQAEACLIYGGEEAQEHSFGRVVSWKHCGALAVSPVS